jgi:hypothetical protein
MLPGFAVCDHKELNEPGDIEVEIWELQLTGQTVGTLKLTLYRTKMNEDAFYVTGEMSGAIRDHRGGLGEADYKLKGKIKKNIFSVSINGDSEMAEGPSVVYGSMKGSFADSHGSGTWHVAHNRGTSSGEYTMKKIHSSE